MKRPAALTWKRHPDALLHLLGADGAQVDA
jgi:hypothetical protein